MTRGNRRSGEGEETLTEMVRLVRSTYSESMAPPDGRGLARLEAALHKASAPERVRSTRWMILALSVVALTLGGTLAYRQFEHVTYEVMNGAVGPGGFVRPTAPGTAILFSEGSEITLEPSARTRVDGLTAHGGHVVVENGSVHARIVPRKRARWFVDAGPYSIRVTGTAFNVKWSWAEQRLDVRMDRGSVVVTGPMAPAGVTLTAGMKLMATPGMGLAIAGGASASAPAARDDRSTSGATGARYATSGDQMAATAPDDEPEEAVAEETPSPLAGETPSPGGNAWSAGDRVRSAPRKGAAAGLGGGVHHGAERRIAMAGPGTGTGMGAPSKSGLPAPSAEPWDRELARGNVQAILDDAAARGMDRVLVSASGRELSALADAARYGHQPVLAHRVLLSVRERFPRSGESRDAAFFLGGLAEDAGGAAGQSAALDWYERYLQESGHGRYAPQALGRKMVLTQRLKGTDAARPVANDYLDRFPGGPYASAARKLTRVP